MKLVYILSIAITLISCKNNSKPTIAKFEGLDLTQNASIERDKATKKAAFISTLSDNWEIYYGNSVDSIDFSKPILTGNGNGSFPLNIPIDKRGYFQLITPKGKAILAERHLPMTGGFNFRDLGGYKTAEGKHVKWGKIIRSDDLATLTDADLYYLASLPLLSDVDYRSKEEIALGNDKRPSSLKNYLEYNISPGNTNAMMAKMTSATSADIDKEMIKMNVFFVTNDTAITQFKKMFEHLQSPNNNVPLLFHCTAGKDRTGMSSALILYALGVDDKTVMDDYLLSNKYIEAKFAKEIKAYPNLLGLFSVKREYLQAGVDAIKKNYGSIDNFLTQKLKVDIKKFREIYLYN